jgi:adenine/guanine phosphoribosyltransferase-like PRPP-binding protein
VPGIVYKDLVLGLLLQPFGLSLCNELFIHRLLHGPGAKLPFDAVLAPEALGFLFAGPIAAFFNRPVLLARKKKPAPGAIDSVTYEGSNMSNLSEWMRVMSSRLRTSMRRFISLLVPLSRDSVSLL